MKFVVKRHLVGILGLALLLVGVTITIYQALDEGIGSIQSGETGSIQFVSLRLGVVLCALWLALPNRAEDIRPSRLLMPLAAIVIVVIRPRLVLALLPALLVVAAIAFLLRPRPKRRFDRSRYR